MERDFDTIKFTAKEKQNILENALFSFHENSKVNQFNQDCLFKQHSNNNPVARIKARKDGQI
jgi:hypothetical protein